MAIAKVEAQSISRIECPRCFQELLSYDDVRAGDKFKCPSCENTSKIVEVTAAYRDFKGPTIIEVELRV